MALVKGAQLVTPLGVPRTTPGIVSTYYTWKLGAAGYEDGG